MATAKTSQSHPLRLDSVVVGRAGGVIGLTFCPGKKQRGASSGDWERDLGIDLEAIQSYGATALVTLMEAQELAAVHVPADQLGSETAQLGLEWHHLPVRDVSVPDEGFEDLWTYAGFRLRALLRRGEKIVIHCLGGLGRTGTVASRLLVELGDIAEAAIRKVRRARPGSIETKAQEDYVRGCSPVATAGVSLSGEERALACLLGGALGDALGYAVEFDSLHVIRARFGATGITEPVFQDGKMVVSDDTQMTLFTLEGLLRSLDSGCSFTESCVESIRRAYLEWLTTQSGHAVGQVGPDSGWLVTQKEMHVRRAPGNTCMAALRAGGGGTMSAPINDSKGCGGVMRVAPLGLIPKRFEPAAAFQLGAQAAALTHGHASGYLSAGMMASTIGFLSGGAELSSAIGQSCRILEVYEGHGETLRAVKRAVALAGGPLKDHATAIAKLGGGWVGEEALSIAVYAVLSAETFVDAVRIAANHSGDSDSTASIAGQLWGARNGIDNMPHNWICALDVLSPLLHLARRLMGYL